jgi:hypothetical protein
VQIDIDCKIQELESQIHDWGFGIYCLLVSLSDAIALDFFPKLLEFKDLRACGPAAAA